MPLPLKTYRVFPNPWALIHHEKGPQGACPVAMRDDAPLRFVGAERVSVVAEERDKKDPRGNRVSISFRFPKLDASLVKGEAIEVTAFAPDGHYYRDRMVDGSLIPADERTAAAIPDARFKTLAAAKAAGVADFDAHHGKGSWDELEKLLADQAKAPVAAPSTAGAPTDDADNTQRKAGKS